MTDAIMGTFVKIGGTLADGTLRLVIDIEPRHAQDAFALFHAPGTPMALARLTATAANSPIAPPEEPKERPGPLCIMACTFCADKEFWKWADWEYEEPCTNEAEAKQLILDKCGITSRKELDTSIAAAKLFHEEIRKPFLAWRVA